MHASAEVTELLSSTDAGLRVVSRGEAGPARQLGVAEVAPAVVRGGVFLTARYALSLLVGLGNVFVLTWWIGPHAYGTFVTAVGLTAFLASLTRFGVDTYLVRCESPPDRRQYDVAFTLVLANSTGLMLLGAAGIPLLRRWYSASEFVDPYLVLLLSIPLTGIAGLPIARLERELRFGTLVGVELGGQFSAFVIALLVAWRGFGVWAPVAGLFVWQAVVLAAAWRAARFSPRLHLDASHVRSMLAFGLGFSASLRTWQLRTLVNPLLVGRFAGPEGVAYVALAVRVVEGLAFVRIAAGRLAIAALARLQHDAGRFRGALQRALTIQVVTVGPLLCAFLLAGPWVVMRFMGVRWLPSLDVYPLVATSVLVHSVFNLQASALFVLGRQWSVMWAYASHVILLALAALILLPRVGIVGYAWAELIACGAYLFIGYNLSKVAAISYRKLVPWIAAFALPLLLAAGNARRAYWLPLVGVCVAIGYKHIPSWRGADEASGSDPSPARKLAHLLTLIAKTSTRGWPYLRAIAEYKVASTYYRIRRTTTRARELFPVDKNGQQQNGFLEQVSPTTSRAFSGIFHFAATDISRIVASIPEALKRNAIAKANCAMQHRFDFRGEERLLGESIDWKASGSSTSWAWDLNRHLWFVRLATAFYYTGNGDYLRELATVWEDWIRRNPPAHGFNWQYPFEVAARLRNWTWAYVMLAYSGVADPKLRARLEAALREHAGYLQSHLEHHWPNNHLLLEAKSLCEFALLFPELAPGLLDRAQPILEREVMDQVLEDGAHSELCSMYHRVIAGELSELALLCERCGKPLSSRVANRIRQMGRFSRALLREDGSTPLLGDSAAEDTCLRFDFAWPQLSDLNYWIAPDFPLGKGGAFPDWKRGKSRLYHPDQVLTEPSGRVELSTFLTAGYAFMTNQTDDGEVHLTFDFGPFSRSRSPNHGHCDALSFELYAHGHALIVDPGVYLPWDNKLPWARHFRGTSAHNTLMIDRKEQSELSDSCNVRRTARVALLRQESDGAQAIVGAECTPYWAEPGGVRHYREITLHQRRVTIRDQVIGSGEHLLEWCFQFSPEVDISSNDDRLVSARLPGQADCLSLSAIADVRPTLDFFHGQTNPLRGWISRDSAEVVPAYAAHYSIRTRLPYEIEFVVDLSPERDTHD